MIGRLVESKGFQEMPCFLLEEIPEPMTTCSFGLCQLSSLTVYEEEPYERAYSQQAEEKRNQNA